MSRALPRVPPYRRTFLGSSRIRRAPAPRVKPEQLSEVMSEFARTMVTDFPIQEILDHLVRRIVDIMPVTAAGVTLISPGAGPRYVAASDESALRFEQLQSALGEGPCLAAAQSGAAISVPDLYGEPRFPTFGAAAVEAGLAAVFTFPLNHGTLRLGALDLYRDTPGRLSPSATRAAQTLADVAAAYLINAQRRAELLEFSDWSREAALHDPLTGLPNRLLMLEMLEHAFRSSRRSGKVSAVFFLDLDQFKAVNDRYGHRTGDELLQAVAQRLAGLLRPGDSLGRLAGDEFVSLCEDLDDALQAEPIALRITAEMSRPFVLGGVDVEVTASIGIALSDDGAQAADQLLNQADLAMYEDKRRGSGEPMETGEPGPPLAGRPGGLARGLIGAAQRGELHLVYQPIVTAADGRLTGAEALLRWTHPAQGPIAASHFVPVAEQSGQIVELGRWVLEQVLTERARWSEPAAAELGVAVNIAAHELLAPGFAGSVAAALQASSVAPRLLTLELTERALVRDPERALVVLNQLRALGVRLALDDFGGAYSVLGQLDALALDDLKIGHGFISRLTAAPVSRQVVAGIIDLAHRLGLTVVAAGVETAEQRRWLGELGADRCQGYHLAEPMRADTLARYRAGRLRS
ncbi:MAG TPA: EAL domain-containing protein [Solirubrobacteraceae bacterium]|nr:EAL domain-containing protein [Solirubrobacteraceae bacterium]